MKIFSAEQIKNWDAFTIQNEPIKSLALMERAAEACFNWYISNINKKNPVKIFCGKGNNGGDGLVIARLLVQKKYRVSVYIIESKSKGSPDFETNLSKLKRVTTKLYSLPGKKSFPGFEQDDVVIDALFGTGLNRKPEGIISDLIQHINNSGSKIISIDSPSGLFIDKSSYTGDKNPAIIHANYTLSFQNQKLAFLLPENAQYTGEVVLLNIGLSKEYEEKESSPFELIDKRKLSKIYFQRKPFTNKGNYGYACLIAGSYGMMGAAILSSRSCLRSGVGKLTCLTCESGYDIIQTSVPEAMCRVSGEEYIQLAKGFSDFNSIGIGPGIGKYPSHADLLKNLFTEYKNPIIIDADALNILSENKDLLPIIPENSILTPHPKEFERLFGKSNSDFDRIELAIKKAGELNLYIILKGHRTFIATPSGKGYFNSTGNAGMATAGSGDVLSGILTGLLAQKYSPENTCILGVFLHGLAGDIAEKSISEEALIAGDLIDHLGAAFKEIRSK